MDTGQIYNFSLWHRLLLVTLAFSMVGSELKNG